MNAASASPGSTGHGTDYRLWQRDQATVAGRVYAVATKPGLFSHGRSDPATVMLAEAVSSSRDQVVVSMPCGHGLVGTVAAASGARQVWMSDRHFIASQAARRTLDANGCAATVVLGHGVADATPDLTADTVAIRVVPEKAVMLQLLHDAARILRPGGRCLLAGGNQEGAKSAALLLQRMFGPIKVLAQHSSHRLVVAHRPEELPSLPPELHTPYVDPQCFREIEVTLAGMPLTLFTRPGVFSWEHLDEATEVLAGQLDISIGTRVLDIGCGAGALGAVAARKSRTGMVRVLDVDAEAVRCAARTLDAAGAANAEAIVSDVASAVLTQRFDLVVANPPFHVGKQVDLSVPHQFIADAFEVLEPGGRLMLVANRTLPYEAMIAEHFGRVMSVYDGRRFKVLTATRGR